ncbi:hypothetical protein J3459_011260 [Metarhizium acridum]|nr:hypothetical protein J3459_011260 [Metarhizium acridum]
MSHVPGPFHHPTPNSAKATNIASILRITSIPAAAFDAHTESQPPAPSSSLAIWAAGIFGVAREKHQTLAVSLTQSACIHSSNRRHPPASSASHETIPRDWRINRMPLQCAVDPFPTRPRSRCRFDHSSAATSLPLPASWHCRRPALTSV